MSSDEIKEQLVDWYGGKESDWKRLSKKKRGDSYEVRVFQNKTLNLIKTVVTEDDDYHMKPEWFPTGEFWIYANEKDLQPEDVDETKSYFSENTDSLDFDIYDKDSLSTLVILKAPDSDYWYDQHSSYLIEQYFGVKNFRTIFEEPCENENILMKDIPIGEVREMCEKAGMKFLGYRNIHLEQ